MTPGHISQPVSPRPLYQQVKDYILEKIHTHQWTPDMKIDSENRLVEHLKVSRMTVNRALRELAAEGKLVRIQGVGTFVSREKPRTRLFEIQSISDEIRERGGEHTCDVHRLAREKVTPTVAVEMGLSLRSMIFHAIMVHRENGHPIQLAERYVNPAVAPEFLEQDFTRTTPSDYLVSVAPPTEVEHVIEATMPDQWTMDLLQIPATEPCLVLHRRTWVNGTVATKNRFIHPGSRHTMGSRFKPV